MISKEDVLKVAQDLHMSPTEKQIQEVIDGYEDEADNDPTGSLPLWIENLLYSLEVKQTNSKLVSELMKIRKDWTIQDFIDAYGDGEWNEIPATLKECHEKMEQYVSHTYDADYIQECIDDEFIKDKGWKYETPKEHLHLIPEDWTKQEWITICKLFNKGEDADVIFVYMNKLHIHKPE